MSGENLTSKRSTYAELMKIAAELARGDGIASDCDEDHPTRMTRQDWLTHLKHTHEASKVRAVRLRRLIDQLCADEPTDPLWRNTLGNLVAAVERMGRKPECPVDLDVQFAMREARQMLGGLYAETKRGSVPCIWRNGCDGKRNCQEAGCCLGSREERGEPDETSASTPDPDEETPCAVRDDGLHCECWYGGNTCCGCGDGDRTLGGEWPTCAEVRAQSEKGANP